LYSRFAGLILILAPAGLCQHAIELTVKIGVPTFESFQTGSFDFLATGLHAGDSATRRYTVGTGAVVRLPRHFEAEVDILYKRLGYDLDSTQPALPVVVTHTSTTANSWEFPLLAVYHPADVRHISPRLAAGVSFRAASGTSTQAECYPIASQYSSFCPSTSPASSPPDNHLNSRSFFGGTFGAGVEMPLGRVRLVPELRYTRWRADSGESGSLFDLRSNPNQLDFLVGITF